MGVGDSHARTTPFVTQGVPTHGKALSRGVRNAGYDRPGTGFGSQPAQRPAGGGGRAVRCSAVEFVARGGRVGGKGARKDFGQGPYRTVRRPPLAGDHGGSPSAQLVGPSGRLKTATDEGCQFATVLNDNRGVGGPQHLGDVAKVVRPGSITDRRSVRCRLDHVLPTAGAEATADKRNAGTPPPRREFSDGIHEKYATIAVRRNRTGRVLQLAPTLPGQTQLVQQALDLCEPFGMPGHDQQSQAGKLVPKFAVGLDDQRFFGAAYCRRQAPRHRL